MFEEVSTKIVDEGYSSQVSLVEQGKHSPILFW